MSAPFFWTKNSHYELFIFRQLYSSADGKGKAIMCKQTYQVYVNPRFSVYRNSTGGPTPMYYKKIRLQKWKEIL